MVKKMFEKAISVTQFNTYIKNIFDAEVMLQGISIIGEITDWKISNNIAYFSIKDSNSMLSCVAFNANEKFSQTQNGEQVILTGSPNYYVKGGRFNFNVYKIEKQGQGLLFLEFLRLKEKLEKEGLFDIINKKSLPSLFNIKTIGVITSETGAVIEDIINVSTRRNPGINLVLYPAKVQGAGASKTIINGLDYFEDKANIDAIIIARGGGSFEDLSCFNDEELARRVFVSNKLIISGVGHETDTTIIDFVSDLRAPTPSAAAELLTFDSYEIKKQINSLSQGLNRAIQIKLENKTNNLNMLKQNFFHKFESMLNENMNKINMLKLRLNTKIDGFFAQKQQELAHFETKLASTNPKDILKRGWAKIEQEDHAVKLTENIDFNKQIKIILQDGSIFAKPLINGENYGK
jgi:exodeoxyribonuclease VII large subunit